MNTRGREHRGLGWRLVGALGVGLLACSTPVGPGTTGLVTQGESPGSVGTGLEAVGGVLELARVRFAATSVQTDLVGDSSPRAADGWTMVVGRAGFATPLTTAPREGLLLLPEGPGLDAAGGARCEVRLGAVPRLENLPGETVDVGDSLRLEGAEGTLRLSLTRTVSSASPVARRVYQLLSRAVSPGGMQWPGNWSSGTRVSLSIPGANPPATSLVAGLPFATSVTQGLSLPLELSDVTVNGTAARLPARDPLTGAVLDTVPQVSLPQAESPLELSWATYGSATDLTLSVELLGGGAGSCPLSCDASCCVTSADCGTGEQCGPRDADGRQVCQPELGSGLDRLGALVCTLPDVGSAQLSADALAPLLAAVPAGRIRGGVLRLGRSVNGSVVLPDALGVDSTRRPLSPMLYRASDVVIFRLETPR